MKLMLIGIAVGLAAVAGDAITVTPTDGVSPEAVRGAEDLIPVGTFQCDDKEHTLKCKGEWLHLKCEAMEGEESTYKLVKATSTDDGDLLRMAPVPATGKKGKKKTKDARKARKESGEDEARPEKVEGAIALLLPSGLVSAGKPPKDEAAPPKERPKDDEAEAPEAAEEAAE